MFSNFLTAAATWRCRRSGWPAGTGRRTRRSIAVSIPAADHGFTAGVVYHAQAAATEIMAAFPNIEVIVKTSPSAAAQVSALEDLSAIAPSRRTGDPALYF